MEGEVSKFDDLITAEDSRGLLREWAKTERAAREGRFCSCEQPDLTGRKSHLCFACGLYNLGRKAEIEAAMRAPHPYEVVERFRGRWGEDVCCDFCAMSRKDPRHQSPVESSR